ncbi:MAG: cyanophycin synthetase [Flavobacterium sp.]|nr:MAG: cyanophycin synthetase [Flavobacterium sp.]
MKILKIQVLRGPNVWSNYRRKLIQMRLDLEDLENYPTNKIDGFGDRLKALMPSMVSHTCSEGHRGGFFSRVETGTWMGHVIEHMALELQTLAGIEVGYGRTRETKESGVYNVVFAYTDEEAGIYTAKVAVKIAEALISGNEYDLDTDIKAIIEICNRNCLGPSTKSIVDEAVKRNIPWIRLADNSMIQLGYGANQMRFQATTTCKTNTLAVGIACNKELTKKLLHQAAIPVPNGGICSDEESLQSIVSKIGYPIVLKPLNGNHGKGASINITNWEEAKSGLEFAQNYSQRVIAERFVTGFDFRVLVINNKFVAAAKRIPAHVIGNGTDSLQTLIDLVNFDTKRGDGHENVLTKIKIDRDTTDLLTKMNYTLETVPAKNEIVYLKSTANLSTGGSSEDVTDEVHPDNIALAERVAKIIGLDICGIDIMADNLSEPLKQNGGVVLEVNAAPGFRMHLAPTVGKSRNVAVPVVDMLFPDGMPSRIPIIAVTGTNGKTTTTRLLAHIAQNGGFKTGFTTTDGIYINNELMQKGDTTGPVSGEYILRDPQVEFAVLETARGGILRSGLCYTQCDVAIITNIKEDHLGLNDIHDLRDLANVKAVVARSVKKNGWAVLNAEDRYCRMVARELDCNVAYFSVDENNEHIVRFAEEGKTTAVFENGYITIRKGTSRLRIAHANNVPLTGNGNITCMVANTLAATLASYVWGFSERQINSALQTFIPSFEQTPGRMNMFELQKFNVLVDYAHNPHGYNAVEDYIKNISAKRKIGIISGVGDRRDEDIRECAIIAGRMFDQVIIRQETDLRGNSEEKINSLLIEGLNASGRVIPYELIADEKEAIQHALNIAGEGDFIISLTEAIEEVVSVIHAHKEKEDKESFKIPQSA